MRIVRFVSFFAAALGTVTAVGCTSLLGDFKAGADPADASHTESDAGSAPSPDGGSTRAPDAMVGEDGGTPVSSGDGGCAPGQLTCAAGCVSPDDPRTCGGCGNDCTTLPHIAATGLSCTGQICLFTCLPGYAHCSTTPSDGCEVDLSSQGNCGACQRTCSGADPVCGPTDAGPDCVFGCPASAPNECSGSCADFMTDDSHCGGCATVCTGGTTCKGGSCVCPSSETSCGGTCYTSDSDPLHCGASCTQCPPPPNGAATCSGGSCGVQCNAPYSACGGASPCAFNTSNDASHCGAGCATCSGGTPVCLDGGCVACSPGATQCSGNTVQTCSSAGVWVSGTTCASPASCSGGACVCPSGYASCSGQCVVTSSDPNNCGGCGKTCIDGDSCVGGACHCPTVTCGARSCGCGGTCCGTTCCAPQ